MIIKHRNTAKALFGPALFATMFAGSAAAEPVVDGYYSTDPTNEYPVGNFLEVEWFSSHGSAGKYDKGNGNTTVVYWDYYSNTTLDDGTEVEGALYLYLEAPLGAKNMAWGDSMTQADLDLYGEKKALSYEKMVSSEDLELLDKSGDELLTADLAYDSPKPIKKDKEKTQDAPELDYDVGGDFGIVQYADSVSYVLNDANGYACEANGDCNASDVPMAYEFLFSGFDDPGAKVNGQLTGSGSGAAFLNAIAQIDYHLSPTGQGDPGSNTPKDPPPNPVPAPSSIALIGLGLLALRRKKARCA